MYASAIAGKKDTDLHVSLQTAMVYGTSMISTFEPLLDRLHR
jgi:hypothetical protein